MSAANLGCDLQRDERKIDSLDATVVFGGKGGLTGNGGLYVARHSFEIITGCAMFSTGPMVLHGVSE
jgi:hypothetical protein